MAIDLAKLEPVRTAPARTGAGPGPGSSPQPLLQRILNARIPGLQGNKVSVDDLALFAQQIALLLKTGNGLAPSVAALSRQFHDRALGKVLKEVHQGLEQGRSLADCMAEHRAVFDALAISLVRAGEATGGLQKGFERLSEILEMRRRLRARIIEAMTYPLVLSVILVGVVIFMMTFMVPRFAMIFAGLGDEIPRSTRAFLWLAAFLRAKWWLLIGLLAAAGFLARWLWRRPEVQRAWDGVKIAAPLAGRLYREACSFQLCSTLSLLFESRVPPLEAIGIARQVIHNSRYGRFFDELEKSLESGRGMAHAFQEAEFFPDTMKLMVATGEASGSLDVVMGKMADRYREDLESQIRRVSALLEPVMLVVMGVVVGFVAVSFILPIFKMSRAIH